jgi:hypothetical protein
LRHGLGKHLHVEIGVEAKAEMVAYGPRDRPSNGGSTPKLKERLRTDASGATVFKHCAASRDVSYPNPCASEIVVEHRVPDQRMTPVEPMISLTQDCFLCRRLANRDIEYHVRK